MRDINETNRDITATQGAILNYEMAIVNAGYDINEVDKGYGGPVPASFWFIEDEEEAQKLLWEMERYFLYLTKVIGNYPGAKELT